MAAWRLSARFLRLFGFYLPDCTHGAPVAEPAPISDDERLSRYVTNEDHFNVTRNQVHFRAFLPPSKENELSIMRTAMLSEDEVWALGTAIAKKSGRTVFARGDFLAPHVRESAVDQWRLTVCPDEPPVRHALIRGWPPAVETEIRKSLAQQLRANAQLRVPPGHL